MENTLRIFEFQIAGEKEWLAANTLVEALINYVSSAGMLLTDFDKSDDIIEIPEQSWDDHFVSYDDGTKKTFREWISVANNVPDIIATTAY